METRSKYGFTPKGREVTTRGKLIAVSCLIGNIQKDLGVQKGLSIFVEDYLFYQNSKLQTCKVGRHRKGFYF